MSQAFFKRRERKGFRRDVVIVCLIIAVLLVVLFNASWKAREAASASACHGHMHQLQHMLQEYQARHGHLPPAYLEGPDGTPWHSWRVLILEFSGHEDFYQAYRFNEPWNSEHNLSLAEEHSVLLYHCTSTPWSQEPQNTNYVVVVGDETAFPGKSSANLQDFKDGIENTILLAEIGNSNIHWMEPRDLKFESLMLEVDPNKASSDAVSSHHPSGPGVAFGGRPTLHRLSPEIGLSQLRSLLTISGGEEVPSWRVDVLESGRSGPVAR